jgi:hypothetical protein
MRTFYRDEHVHITSSAIHVDGHRYALDQLDQIWRSGRRLAGRRVLIGVAVLVGAVGFTAAVRYTWWFGGLRRQFEHWLTGGPVTVALLGAVALVAAIVGVLVVEAGLRAIEDIRGHARDLQLWASVRGRPVLLLHTNDETRFGKVCRALARAHAGVRLTDG